MRARSLSLPRGFATTRAGVSARLPPENSAAKPPDENRLRARRRLPVSRYPPHDAKPSTAGILPCAVEREADPRRGAPSSAELGVWLRFGPRTGGIVPIGARSEALSILSNPSRA